MNQLPGYETWGPLWESIVERAEPPGTGGATIIGLVIAAVLIGAPYVFSSRSLTNPANIPKFLITQTHEGAHAFTALACRHGLTAIRLERDHSGTTHTLEYPGFGAFLVGFIGYLGPGLAAALIGVLAGSGFAMAAIASYALLSVVMLLFMRNTVGLTFVGAIVVLTFLTVWSGNQTLALIISLSTCWYLAAGGVASAAEQWRVIRKDPEAGADAQNLHLRTRIPATVWAAIHFAGAVLLAALAVGFMVAGPAIPA